MDEHLRQLERAWKQSGAQADRVRLIEHRLLTGVIERANVVGAASLGDLAAAALTAPDLSPPATRAVIESALFELKPWSGPWSEEARLRVILASEQAMRAAKLNVGPFVDDPRMKAALHASEAFISGPSEETRQAATDAFWAMLEDDFPWGGDVECTPDCCWTSTTALGWLAALAAFYAGTSPLIGVAHREARAATDQIGWSDRPMPSAGDLDEVVRNTTSEHRDVTAKMELAVQDELIPWALGDRDPVRERVSRRESERERERP